MKMEGKTVLITGCNSGIGLSTARLLAEKGARIIGLARTQEKAQNALAPLPGEHVAVVCELSDLTSIKNAISQIDEELDVIIANAGIMAVQQLELIYGIESHLFVNHFAHAFLIDGLLGQLKSDGRVLVLSSGAHNNARSGIDLNDLGWKRRYSAWAAYGQSKLANILYVKALAKKLGPKQVAHAIHPGIIATNLWRHVPDDKDKYTMKSSDEGAATSVILASERIGAESTANYWSGGKIAIPSQFALNIELRDELWKLTQEFIQEHR